MIQRIHFESERSNREAVRPRPPLLRALGADDPPVRVEINGATFHRIEIFKHDSWAATALYSGPDGDVVCKFHRQQHILGVPMTWLGRLVARHEITIFQQLNELDNIPAWTGVVHIDGRPCANAVAHEFIPGEPLQHDGSVDEQFLLKCQQLLTAIHQRGVAYCDLHKRENVLVGEDGEPYLFDFQISYLGSDSWIARLFLSHTLLNVLQRSDDYHLQKHISRCQGRALATPVTPPWWIRLHRMVAVPFRTVRRRFLVALGIRGRSGKCETETSTEYGLRPRTKQAGGSEWLASRNATAG